MSCCGRGATTPGGAGSAGPSRKVGRRTSGDKRGERTAYLQYTGPSYLMAIGPFSGRSYHFASTGAVLAVDPRDRRSLEAIPKLQRIRPGSRGW
jgi:hypothetical protein